MSALDNINSMINKYNDEIKRIKNQMNKEYKILLKELFTEIFNMYPNVHEISWTQYTPYFNDGEPCIFSVNDIEFVYSDNSGENNGILYDDKVARKFPALKKLQKALSRSEDALLSLFGDHVRVIVTREGITVDEYDHD